MIWGAIKAVMSGGALGTIERVASEYIETAQETAEAGALMIKTLDPNGLMRREISRFTCVAYAYYLLMTSILALVHAFGVGDSGNSKEALTMMTDLFLPITGAWTAIVSASFGVNVSNVVSEHKLRKEQG